MDGEMKAMETALDATYEALEKPPRVEATRIYGLVNVHADADPTALYFPSREGAGGSPEFVAVKVDARADWRTWQDSREALALSQNAPATLFLSVPQAEVLIGHLQRAVDEARKAAAA